MEKKTAYYIFPEKFLIVEYYAGNIKLADIMALKRQLMQDDAFDVNYNILVDFRETVVEVNEKEVRSYIKFIEDEESLTGERTTVFVTSNPEHVVLFTMFENLPKNVFIRVHIVSTVTKAIAYLRLPMTDVAFIESTFIKLKNL